MALRFNPPPGWPAPPPGFVPDPGWQPDPTWPPAPPGWQLWVPDDAPGDPASAGYGLPGPLAAAGVAGPSDAAALPGTSGEAGVLATSAAGGVAGASGEAGGWVPPSPATEPQSGANRSPEPAASGQPSGPGWAAPVAPPAGTSGMAVAGLGR